MPKVWLKGKKFEVTPEEYNTIICKPGVDENQAYEILKLEERAVLAKVPALIAHEAFTKNQETAEMLNLVKTQERKIAEMEKQILDLIKAKK